MTVDQAVCNACRQGFDSGAAGIIKQFSNEFPNVRVMITNTQTSEILPPRLNDNQRRSADNLQWDKVLSPDQRNMRPGTHMTFFPQLTLTSAINSRSEASSSMKKTGNFSNHFALNNHPWRPAKDAATPTCELARQMRSASSITILAVSTLLAIAGCGRRGGDKPTENPELPAACKAIAENELKNRNLSPYGELPAKYVYTAEVEEPAALVDGDWITIVRDGPGKFKLDPSTIDPKKSLLLFAPDQVVEVDSSVKAKNIVIFAGDLKVGKDGLLDVSAPKSNLDAAPKPATPTQPGSHGHPGAPGAPGADGGMLVLLLQRNTELSQSLPGVAKFADLGGQPGQAGQPGGDGAPGLEKSSLPDNSTCGTYYSSSWDHGSYQRGLEECRGAMGGAGGNAGIGGNGGMGGAAGPLYLLGTASKSADQILKKVEGTPGQGGAGGAHGQPAAGGRGAPGRFINERHCWKSAFWTDCETNDRHHRGHTGHRGPSGSRASTPLAHGQAGKPFEYPAPTATSVSGANGHEASWTTALLEHMESRVLRLSETGLHHQAQLNAENALHFSDALGESAHKNKMTVRDARAIESLYQMRDALRSGLSANGDSRGLPNHLPLLDTKELADGLRFEAATFARRRELYELLRAADRTIMSAPTTLKQINEQIRVSERAIIARFESLAALNATLRDARENYDRKVLELDANFEKYYGKKIAELSTEEWKKVEGNAHADLTQVAGTLAAVGITVLTDGAAAPFAATLVSYGSTVVARGMRQEAMFRFEDVGTIVADYKEFKEYNSDAARAEREVRSKEIAAETKPLKKAKLVLDYAKDDRKRLERSLGKLKTSVQEMLASTKELTSVIADAQDFDPVLRKNAELLSGMTIELERLHGEVALHVNDISRLSELILWLETVRGEVADALAQNLARKFAADQLWKLDVVRSTRIRRAMNAHQGYVGGQQPALLESSWNDDELEYSKLLEAMEASLPFSRALEEVHAAEIRNTVSIQIPWRSTPNAEYEIRIGQDARMELSTVRCIRIEGLGKVTATISHGADHWLQSHDGKFSHYTMVPRVLGRFTAKQSRACFSESLLPPALLGSWSLILDGVNEGHICEQSPLIVHFETSGH
jgi:hypothetical protein